MTSTVSPFSLGATNDLSPPLTRCCNPRPRPMRPIPTQREPSVATDKASTPSIPALDFNALGLYALDDPGRHLSSVVSPPIQRLPEASCTRSPAAENGGT